MSKLAMSDLTERLRDLLTESPLRDGVRDVSVEPSDLDDDTVRVTISLDDIDNVKTRDASQVIHLIWDRMADVDERFFSVSFAEAA